MLHNLQNLPIGWRFKSTPGHGYLYIPQELLEKMPESAQAKHPFEEDCDYMLPVWFFKELFEEEVRQSAEKTVKNWNYEIYEETTGETLQMGESTLKDDKLFYQNNVGRLATVCAFGDWRFQVPRGFTYVIAKEIPENPGHFPIFPGPEFGFLVKHEKYDNRTKSYIIDPKTDVPFVVSKEFYKWDDWEKKTGSVRPY